MAHRTARLLASAFGLAALACSPSPDRDGNASAPAASGSTVTPTTADSTLLAGIRMDVRRDPG